MRGLDGVLDGAKMAVKLPMRRVAYWLNALSGGRLRPNAVTLTGLVIHIPIAILIARRQNIWAAILLVIFGLFDALDGELARLQKRTSSGGMLLDSTSDRVKEVLLYCGAAYAFVAIGRPYMSVWAVAACGASLLVSYVNAWGEVVTTRAGFKHDVNQAFRGGLMRFEVRMLVLLLGLVTGRVILAVIVIAATSALTIISRFARITRELADS